VFDALLIRSLLSPQAHKFHFREVVGADGFAYSPADAAFWGDIFWRMIFLKKKRHEKFAKFEEWISNMDPVFGWEVFNCGLGRSQSKISSRIDKFTVLILYILIDMSYYSHLIIIYFFRIMI
jgi:hypothetical protein